MSVFVNSPLATSGAHSLTTAPRVRILPPDNPHKNLLLLHVIRFPRGGAFLLCRECCIYERPHSACSVRQRTCGACLINLFLFCVRCNRCACAYFVNINFEPILVYIPSLKHEISCVSCRLPKAARICCHQWKPPS